MPDANITLLADKQADQGAASRKRSPISRARAKPSDAVFVLLIGHGSFNGTPGGVQPARPRSDRRGLGEAARPSCRRSASRSSTPASSSGAFLPALAAPGRVVVTATKTGGERNETQFPEFFVAAFGDAAADRDRNGHVSIAEAFEYAKTKVVQAFQQKGLLLTEHAVMDDGGEGQLASTLFLGTGRAEGALAIDLSDPAMKALADEKDALDQQIAALRLKKSSMDEAQYDAQLEKLLTDLALKTKAIRDLQAKKDKPVRRAGDGGADHRHRWCSPASPTARVAASAAADSAAAAAPPRSRSRPTPPTTAASRSSASATARDYGFASQRLPWSHDYPAGEQHFMKIMNELSLLDPHTAETNILTFDDPQLFQYPVAYLCEPGGWALTDQEAASLRSLSAEGRLRHRRRLPRAALGQLRVADPAGAARGADLSTWSWRNPIFHSFFEIQTLDVPQVLRSAAGRSSAAIYEDNDPTKRHPGR